MRTALLWMFERRGEKRTFSSAPLSVASVVAGLMQPTLTVAVLLLATVGFSGRVRLSDGVLCLVVFALSFPGPDRFEVKWRDAGLDILMSWILLLTLLLLFGWVTNSFHYFRRDVLVTWGVLTPVLQWSAVAIGRVVLRKTSEQPEARRTAVLVGAGSLGLSVAHALQHSGDHRIGLVGCFDDRSGDRLHTDASTRLLGGLDDLAPYIREHSIKEVYITLPLSSKPRIVDLLENMQGTTASIFFVPDMVGIGIIQGRLQDLNGVPVVGICETPFTGINKLVKRVSDVVLASLILVAISPLLLAIAIGVKLSSPGPAIFKQRRNGLYGDEFTVYKFRTMTTQDDGPVVAQATRNDPRITRLGCFLRRTSLDELPQFFNVLQGCMSIVGPRPHAVAHNEQYRQIIKAYMVRHKVKPGITGWAQVNGLRGETDTVEKMKARVEYDLEYLRNWSIGLDLKIMVRTIRVVLFDRGAY
jgi:putative colanic acid biosynthesis UDP-glucose lipid carrier transferase